MKKLLLSIGLAVAIAFGAFAEVPKYFAFSIGTEVARDFSAGTTVPITPVGLQFQFDKTFSGGFTFDASSTLPTLLNLSITPIENAIVSIYTGGSASSVAFGVGLGYDFLKSTEKFYSAMGVYLDWIATTSNLTSGGTLCIGLKTSFGM